MAISRYPSCVRLPCVAKPYPAILDFLVQRFPQVEPSVWELRIRQGKVLDEAGVAITNETLYQPRQQLFYFRELPDEPQIPLAEKIVFHNAELLVACKPPFLPVTPAGIYINECLLNRLKLKTGNSDLVPLHRIDRETAGLVLFSCNPATRARYAELFATGKLEKSYEALSALKQCPQGSDWTVENRLVETQDPWFLMQPGSGAINARSKIKLLDFRENRAHFLLLPLTGKKHQLRVHMCGLGFGIMHDNFYPQLLPKQADLLDQPLQLIARRLKFIDPVSGQALEFESERKLLD